MKNYIIINNKILPEEKALISVKDRGFRFGDGVFETCLISNQIIYNWQAHLIRLKTGLEAIKIKFNKRNFGKNIQQSCCQLIKKNKIENGYLRIAISRGVGSVGYLPLKNIQPTIVIETFNLTPKPKPPIKLWVSKIEKPSAKSLPINYKLMNGINSTLVKMEAIENGCFDGIILNNKKQICETSSANIFWIKNDVLYTPRQDCGYLQGTIREKIISLSSVETGPINIKLVKAKLDNLLNADEVFITNVALGVLSVDQIENVKFKNKKYGKVFADLLSQDIKIYTSECKN